MRIQFFVQVLSILTAVQAEYLLAERSEPELSRRQDVFAGGWSLRQSVCPTGTFQCPKYKGLPACCPDNSECEESYMTGFNYVACCPRGKNDCSKTIQSLPVCANPDWILWTHKTLYKSSFCCLPGQKAYVTTQDGNHPACGPENLAVAATNVASTVRPATATDDSISSTFSSSNPKSFPTSELSSSSNSNTAENTNDINVGGSKTTSNTRTSSSSSSKSFPMGAKIGAVIGVLALVGIFMLLFFYIFRRSRIKAARAAAAATSSAGQGHQYHGSEVKITENAADWTGSSGQGMVQQQQYAMSPYWQQQQQPVQMTAPPYEQRGELSNTQVFGQQSETPGMGELDGQAGRR